MNEAELMKTCETPSLSVPERVREQLRVCARSMAEAMRTACNDLLRPDAQRVHTALTTIVALLTKGDAAAIPR